jgi:hypothetical protein
MGKKGGSETKVQYDPVASKKMAKIAERQQEMAEEQWGMYKEFFQDYEISAAQANKELLPYMTDTTKEMFTAATEGLDTGRRQDEAEADVVAAYDKVPGAMRREAAQYGIDPSSNRFLSSMKNLGLEKAKTIAGARTGVRERTDTERFNRLAVATNKQPLQTVDPAGRAMGGMGMAAQTYRPLATRVLSKEYQDNSNIWDFAGDVGGSLAGVYVGKKYF